MKYKKLYGRPAERYMLDYIDEMKKLYCSGDFDFDFDKCDVDVIQSIWKNRKFISENQIIYLEGIKEKYKNKRQRESLTDEQLEILYYLEKKNLNNFERNFVKRIMQYNYGDLSDKQNIILNELVKKYYLELS